MADDRIIVLVTRDAGLRSAIAAALGIAGIAIVTVDDCKGARAGAHLRRAGTLIVDDELGHSDRKSWADDLRQRTHPARLIILTNAPADDWDDEDIALVHKVQAAPAILKLLRG
jgi:DNA-binding response OmpR family regulator